MFVCETKIGPPIPATGMRLRPIAKSIRLKLGRWVWVWARPSDVIVEPDEPGAIRRMHPIRDRTRELQLAILGAGLLGALLLKLAGHRRTDR